MAFSAAEDVRSGTTVVLELNEVPLDMPEKEGANCESLIFDASDLAAPAAAMICGLNGLFEELATLPFLECCIPCTILVCR